MTREVLLKQTIIRQLWKKAVGRIDSTSKEVNKLPSPISAVGYTSVYGDQCFEHGGASSRFIPCVTESRMQHNKYVERKGYCLSYPVLFQSLCLLLRRSPLKTCKNHSPCFRTAIVDFSCIVNKEPWTVNLFIINGFGICPNKTSRHLLKFNCNFPNMSLPPLTLLAGDTSSCTTCLITQPVVSSKSQQQPQQACCSSQNQMRW